MFRLDPDDDQIEAWCFCGNRIVQPKPAATRRASAAAAVAAAATTDAGQPPAKIQPTPITFKRSKTGTIRGKGPTPFQAANAAAAAAAAAHPLKTSTGTIIRRNGSSGRVAVLGARGGSNGANGEPEPSAAAGGAGGPAAQSITMPAADGPVHASPSPGALPTPPASLKNDTSGKTVRSNSSSSLKSPTAAANPTSPKTTATYVGKTLYCSPECAAADQHNVDLASHLSEALHLYSPPTGFSHDPQWSSYNVGLPSPFFVSGSDSDSNDYFHRPDDAEGSSRQPLGFIAHGTGVRRYSARSATTATTTTGSSSDSLASMWDPSQQQYSSSMAPSTSSHGLRRMTPLHSVATPSGLATIASVPISVQTLVPPPPASSPLPPSYVHHSSPLLVSAESGYHANAPNSFSSSSSLANYRSASHSRAYIPTSAAPSRQPSLQGSSSSSSATFEPGSAPAVASTLASYSASFQRTPSVEARLASYGSPRRMSTASVSSLRNSRLHGSGDDLMRGRTAGTGTDGPPSRLRSRSRASDAAVSEEGDDDGAGSSSGCKHTTVGSHPQQITPTQSSLLSQHGRPANPRRPSSVSTDSNSAVSCASSSASSSSFADEPALAHPVRPASAASSSSTSLSALGGARKSSEYLSMAPPASTVRIRPPPAPSRISHAGGRKASASSANGAGDGGWSWGKERMYEIPRAVPPSADGPTTGGKTASLGKLFYWEG